MGAKPLMAGRRVCGTYEFLDNANFPVELYVREARRVMGEHLFKESDVTNAREFHRADSIAIGDYPMDSHLVSTAVSATHIGYGTLRMEPVRMSLGQAAA